MFHENLKTMRKAKGYTQEELAIKLNVVRQTVSKWEKGLSVPDADVLCKIADVLDMDVSTLLGEEIVEETDKSAVAQQLAKISEQLAMKNQHSKKNLESGLHYFVCNSSFLYLGNCCIQCDCIRKYCRQL